MPKKHFHILYIISYVHKGWYNCSRQQTKAIMKTKMSSCRILKVFEAIVLSFTLTAAFNMLLSDLFWYLKKIRNYLLSPRNTILAFLKQQPWWSSSSGFSVSVCLAGRRIHQVLETQFLQRLLGHQLAGKHKITRSVVYLTIYKDYKRCWLYS